MGGGYAIESPVTYDRYRDVDIVFLTKDGYRIELVSPRGKESVVGKLITRIGNSPYHICYEVDNLDETVDTLRHEGYVICSERNVAPALDNREAIFMINHNVGMIELVEKVE